MVRAVLACNPNLWNRRASEKQLALRLPAQHKEAWIKKYWEKKSAGQKDIGIEPEALE